MSTIESPAESALRCALDQEPGEHDVCTVSQRYLSDVLSALRTLRVSYEARGAVIERLTRPVTVTDAVVEPRLCTCETCPDEVVRKGAGL